ncbi:heavy metal translocating P-type ATPase [Congregibacter litoralis]|uniref:Copper--translocating P-type ATPase/heavy metal-(Cd/Co/Hg/Pb/Zn)-translocating P-type ATPase n=1 Tax=Congregibacter litoralis KT71 TaxID=314285 RepID=A4A3W9_9GAMM|nr:heavy metal translocating P-type ATPase [Congregibacter litoralis]EAQ99392.1 copper--translocating P-type ATPase/heavy metal-(Cd/Co/Hg/Pb/Zn)-translocating P-type ATPase [Congregibacter litoralis KT71]
MNSAEPLAIPSEVHCFHCGEDVPEGADFRIDIAGQPRDMCCPGCRAVASMIAENGLERFYEQRTAFNERPGLDPLSPAPEFVIYDDPALAEQFSRVDASGHIDARLLIGGVSCAACTWLIETTLTRTPGVLRATLNLGQNRLDVSFDPGQLTMSDVFTRIASLGYRVQPWQSNLRQEQAKDEYRTDLRRLAVAGIGMMQVGMFAIALHAGDIQGISADYQQLMRLFSLLVTSFVVAYSARGFFESAWRHLQFGALVMDLPVALAIGLAYCASAFATFSGSGAVYFDSVVMFTFLLLLARFLEKRLRYRDAMDWQDAEQTLPDAVQVWRNNQWTTIPRRSLSEGERVLVRAGDTLPIDGTVERGTGSVREDSFSGEALPRSVTIGDTVYAGTVNLEESLELRATGSYAETRLAALQRSIDQAQKDKPAIARLADRIASRFIAGILLIASLTAFVWWSIDPDKALWIALSVLVISCPCALSLATPASLANATHLLRRRGVIVNGENALESLASLDVALFDKTGTLTSGDFALKTVLPLSEGWDDATIRAIAASMQRHSNHPLASAFAAMDLQGDVGAVSYRPGKGLEGRYGGRQLRLGSLHFCKEIAPELPPEPKEALYWIALCEESQAIAWLGLSDEIHGEALPVLEHVRAKGVATELLTGDASQRATQLGTSLKFERIATGLSPEDKLARLTTLQEAGATVLMVGDGLNDAPVLKRADVSIAVAGATDLARAQADFVIMDGDLRQITQLVNTAQRTRQIIIQNFSWALAYNALGIPLAAMGWVPPWAAAVGMSLSSLLVVGNAARLRRTGPVE